MRELVSFCQAFEAFEHEDKGFVLAVALKPVLAALGINMFVIGTATAYYLLVIAANMPHVTFCVSNA